ncbi:hypothetical protein [Marinomonas ostreistagni]|uniref:hypothetical protein n=1 Tax=Marinomonas ostreistagni TaxID=359209 RepID=UPI00194F9CFD|nr:hypothetical protein [Marinomonas ostreistagni]MBM6549909.1 hypothetical protein [Marinomonas ostreistagni]
MAATLHSLVTPSDYLQLEDGSWALPTTGEFLNIEGASCHDPHIGALEYNRSLIRHLKRQEVDVSGESRYQRIFRKYARNRRIRNVLAVAAAIRAKQVPGEANMTQRNAFNSFTPIESILFFHVPAEYLKA